MDEKPKIKKQGISLRMVYAGIIIGAVIICGMMVFLTFRLSSAFSELAEATDEYIELDKAANELMEASDYLTEKVQRFTATGNTEYLNAYFTEALETKRRENAIEKMAADPDSEQALKQLQKAMRESEQLMEQEYYAMRLVIDAKGITGYPDSLQSISLSSEDAKLSAEEKTARALDLVLGETYYEKKDAIRSNMKESLGELEKLTHSTEKASKKLLRSDLAVFRIIIAVQTVGIFVIIWLTSRLGINPILKAVDKIKDNSPIPEAGANEFRYLAQEYNKMYSVYKTSVEHLNFKASHDELTGVYNRSGYDLLLSGIDLDMTYLLIFDIDDFKAINDTHGHEMGDRVLKKVSYALLQNFRADDYVCRIGGDEFVVLMTHSGEQQHNLIINKVNEINHELADTSDGTVPVSISAGVAHGSRFKDSASLFRRADEALYHTKRNGKAGMTFDQ